MMGFVEFDESAIEKEFTGKEYLIKYNDNYYTYSDLKIARSIGSGFDSTFACSKKINSDSKIPVSETSSVTLKMTGDMAVKLVTSRNKTFSLAMKIEVKTSMSEADKNLLKEAVAEYKKAFSQEYSVETDDAVDFDIDDMLVSNSSSTEMIGVFRNDDGILHLEGKEYSYDSYDEDSDGSVAKDLEGAILLYDDTNVYMAESLKISSEPLN